MIRIDTEHTCPHADEVARLRATVEQLRAQLAGVEADEVERLRVQLAGLQADQENLRGQLAVLQRAAFGQKSERMPSMEKELRQKDPVRDLEAVRRKRRETWEAKQRVESVTVHHPVPERDQVCPRCGGDQFRPLGEGEEVPEWDWLPGRLIKRRHLLQKLTCRCGEHIVTAERPDPAVPASHYGAGLVAHVVVGKCADAIPLHRMEKQFERAGVPLSRSTLGDLFHAAAEQLVPLYELHLKEIAASELVQADETRVQVQAKGETRTAWMWTFLDEERIGYVYSPSRSGETPQRVLGGTSGNLMVDAYTAYNRVSDVDGRLRSGCLAHARRKFHEAKAHAPLAQQALMFIREVYRVEHEALEQGIVRTPAHGAMRHTRSRDWMDQFHAWLTDQDGRWPPQGLMAKAVGYALNQWVYLTRFLSDVKLPLDNNASERALRIHALIRKNSLTVGHDLAGRNLAVLSSLVETCEAHEINPEAWLADVLLRLPDIKMSARSSLLPQHWKPLEPPPSTEPDPAPS